MSELLRSVGLDVGTTTTQLIVSELQVENRASAFSVPEMEITQRRICYRGGVHFTPLLDNAHVDGAAIRDLVAREYEKAGITRQSVDTGAIIITGETSRKENARTVLSALSEFAGEFVVATAGPDLESILAAKGAGATVFSQSTGKTVLHMDIGGGTSNLALITDGRIVQTGCLNVGGRLVKLDANGVITYCSPVLQGLWDCSPGQIPTPADIQTLTDLLTKALEMAAGMRKCTPLLDHLLTREAASTWQIPKEPVTVSFSGGVADCIETVHPARAFGDIGPELGQAIAQSRLCQGAYRLGSETIRATVIGAGCHSAQLSGSTVFHRKITFPLQNLPVIPFTFAEQEQSDLSQLITRRIQSKDAETVVLAFPGYPAPAYRQVSALAEQICRGAGSKGIFICLEGDMAKALGHCLCLHLPESTPCLCIDRVRLNEDSFLDIGAPVGPALPVVVKTLILSH